MATIECPATVEVGPQGEPRCVDGVGLAGWVMSELELLQLIADSLEYIAGILCGLCFIAAVKGTRL